MLQETPAAHSGLFVIELLRLVSGFAAGMDAKALEELCKHKRVRFVVPSRSLCGDNGAMIAVQGYYEFISGSRADSSLNASALDSIEHI